MNDDNPLSTPAHQPAVDTQSPPHRQNRDQRGERRLLRREQQTEPLLVKVGGSLLDWPDLPHFLRAQTPIWLAERRGVVLIVGGGRWADEIRAADQRFQLGPAAAHQLAIQVMSLTARLLVKILPEASWCGDWQELIHALDHTTSEEQLQPQMKDAELRPLALTSDEPPDGEPPSLAAPLEVLSPNLPPSHGSDQEFRIPARLHGPEQVTGNPTDDRVVSPPPPDCEHEQPFPRLIVFDCQRFLEHQEPMTPGCPLPHTWDSTSDSIAARVAVAAQIHELLLLKSTDIPADIDLAQAAAAGWVDACFPTAAEPLHKIDWMNPRTQQQGKFVMRKR